MNEMSERTIQRALQALSEGRELLAGDTLVDHLEDLFLAGDFDVAGQFLALLDVERLPPDVLSGVLMISKHAKAELGGARTVFFDRARKALSETWHLHPSQVDSICRRHA